MILEGKTVVVSGVGPGLGREIAVASLRDGARVVLGARTPSKLEVLAKELDPTGERVTTCRTDILQAAQCEALVRTAVERFGRLDALVHVAAVDAVFGGLLDSDVEDWRPALETNFFGTLRLTRSAVPALKERGGAVVFVGSQATFLPQTPQMAYAASKGALYTAMFYLARELGPDRIRVNTVVPTWMWGPPVQGYVKMTAQQQGRSEEDVVAEIAQRMPLGEIPSDGDVAEAVVFLCSDRARMITGQSLFVNGGELMR